MAAIEELIRTEKDGAISFGDHTLNAKAKKEDYESGGDVYKVKTYNALTRLEKNGLFLYESVPGTSVGDFKEDDKSVSFRVYGGDDAQITLGMKDDTAYEVFVGQESIGEMKTGLGGKLSISVELSGEDGTLVKVEEK
ncbi:MAG: endosialidase [Lachnospiraceae bacterium]|nr:endosialidase [Lachnospiraceae bacterium]